jgi:hypothetical protein
VARERLQQASGESSPGAPNWAVRERLLAWLAEPDIDPDARTGEELAQGRAVLKGLGAILDLSGPRDLRAADIRQAITALESRSPLEVTDLKLCLAVHGFGSFDAIDPVERKPGQAVVLYCEMAGVAYEPMGAAYRSRLSGQVEIIPEGSNQPAWSQPLGAAEDVCRKRRRDYYVNYRVTFPESLAPGRYRVRITQKDQVSDSTAVRETPLTLVK